MVRKFPNSVGFASIALLGGLITASAAAQPAFIPLGDLPGGTFDSQAAAISADGTTVTGSSRSTAGLQAFRWTRTGGIVGIGDLSGGAFSSEGIGVNSDGSVIVGRSVSTPGTEAFRWTASIGMQGLGFISTAARNSEAWAVSGDGEVVAGRAMGGTRAIRWTQVTGMTTLSNTGDIAQANAISLDGTTIAGTMTFDGGDGVDAFRWTAGGGIVPLPRLPVGTECRGTDISFDGNAIIGYCFSSLSTNAIPFRWSADTGTVPLTALDGSGPSAFAFATDMTGRVIVGQWAPGGIGQAFVKFGNDDIQSLRTFLVNNAGLGASLAGWQLTTASGVSADGRVITGYGTNPAGFREAWVVVVPEPILLPSVLFLLRVRRRAVSHYVIQATQNSG